MVATILIYGSAVCMTREEVKQRVMAVKMNYLRKSEECNKFEIRN